MADWTLQELPFLERAHLELGARAAKWPTHGAHEPESDEALGKESRAVAADLAAAGFLDIVIPRLDTGKPPRIDVRSVCVLREAFGYKQALADNVLAMQGIGTAAIWLFGTKAQQDKYLEPCRSGRNIAALALSEPAAGSDVANLTATARRDGQSFVLDGQKTWITNAGIAAHYIVFARTSDEGARGLSAFMVDADTPGLTVEAPIPFMAPHIAATLTFSECRIPASNLVGEVGQGFKIAMSTLDIFRASVGAAGVGFARRAFDEALAHVAVRKLYGKPMNEIEGVQSKLAEMSIDIELATLAVYKAGWLKDTRDGRFTAEVSMAKLAGSEAAHRVVDAAVQLFGGLGVKKGTVVEQLYREVRPMRIYEGASEVQKTIIGRAVAQKR